MVKKKRKGRKKQKKKNSRGETRHDLSDNIHSSQDTIKENRGCQDFPTQSFYVHHEKTQNITINISDVVDIPVNICFCQNNSELQDIESLLRTIEGTDVSTKQMYPHNHVWAEWSTH